MGRRSCGMASSKPARRQQVSKENSEPQNESNKAGIDGKARALKRRNSHMDMNFSGNEDLDRALVAVLLLLQGSLLLVLHIGVVYLLGKESIISVIFIYAPITFMLLVHVRDKYSHVVVISCLIAIAHGLAHLNYPFLDDVHGVNHEVDVWQDQCVHCSQAFLFAYIWWDHLNQVGKVAVSMFTLACIVNIGVGYHCWNSWCYDLYVWVSLPAAIASGLHFAIGAMFKCPPGVGKWLCFFQGLQTIGFYFFFKSSDEVLKIFATTRFFEIYFIVPHFIGFINGRLDLHFKSASECTSPVAHVLGVERTPTNKRRHGSAFFPTDFDTAK